MRNSVICVALFAASCLTASSSAFLPTSIPLYHAGTFVVGGDRRSTSNNDVATVLLASERADAAQQSQAQDSTNSGADAKNVFIGTGEEADFCDVPEMSRLFDRIGGEPALRAAVDEMYERLIVDDKVAKYFKGVAMDKLKGHQYNFMYLAFTEVPEGCDIAGMLTKGHDRLWDMGLDETDFDVVAGHFVATLQHLNVAQQEIDDAVSVVVPLRGIFARPPPPLEEEENSSS